MNYALGIAISAGKSPTLTLYLLASALWWVAATALAVKMLRAPMTDTAMEMPAGTLKGSEL